MLFFDKMVSLLTSPWLRVVMLLVFVFCGFDGPEPPGPPHC